MRTAVPGTGLGRLLLAAALIATGRAECQQDGCESVVMVRCAPEAAAAQAARPDQSRRSARKKLESRRLRQVQAQAGLNAIEVTGEPPTERAPDPWETFRQSMATAAVPSCFSQEAFPAAQGLLRLPVLLGGAATGKCR